MTLWDCSNNKKDNTQTYLLASFGEDGLSNCTVVIEKHLVQDPEHRCLWAQPCPQVARVSCVHQLLHEAIRAEGLGIDVLVVCAYNVTVSAHHSLVMYTSQCTIPIHKDRIFTLKINTWNKSIGTIFVNKKSKIKRMKKVRKRYCISQEKKVKENYEWERQRKRLKKRNIKK